MNDICYAERLFTGALAEEYDKLVLICPAAAEISRRVGAFIGGWALPDSETPLQLLEIGCGTGITTACILESRQGIEINSVDNAPEMLEQARRYLASSIAARRLSIHENDALSHLESLPEASVDVVASAYTLHNFLAGYRERVLAEIFRVLKPGGLFVNGDRYAVDDSAEHLQNTQNEVRSYFKVFTEINRVDLLEQWIVHMFSDESADHIMRMQEALDTMARIGFQKIAVHFREGTNALVSAVKTN